MALLDSQRSIVVLIDLQGKLMDLVERSDRLVPATIRLLRLAQLFEVPVVLTEQYPEGLGSTHHDVRAAFDELTVPRRVVVKDSFSCCGEPDFERALEASRPQLGAGERQLVIGGIEAHICVVQTVLGLRAHGEEVQVCFECTSGRGNEYVRWALERMGAAGATITNQESVGFEWAGDKDHPAFREMSRLFKEGQLI